VSGGTTSLDQVLPSQSGAAQEHWISTVQPIPHNEYFGGGEGLVNDAVVGNALHARDALLEGLEQEYVLEAHAEVRCFLRVRPTAIALLFEAAAHIKEIFGPGRVKAIRLVRDEIEGATVFGIVFWSDSLDTGKEALSNFDRRWWLRNCNRASGVVNFNIELA
jgi:hypothetical protein